MITRLTRRINASGETVTTSELGGAAPSLPSIDAVNAALVLLAGIAAWLSYASVRAVAVGVFGQVGGSAFPLLLDCAVFVSSERYIRSALANLPMNGFRTLSHVLIVGTIAANVSAAHDTRSMYFHAIPPALFAALVELRGRQALREVQKAEGAPDRIPLRLWLTAPLESFGLSMWAARAVSFAGLRAERERYLTGRKALRIAVRGRGARVARRLVRRQLRTGTLSPGDLVAATGLDVAVVGTGPEAVLRVALRAALGAQSAAPVASQAAASDSPEVPVSGAEAESQTPENAQEEASLSPLPVAAANGHKRVAAAAVPAARRAARVTARIGVDREEAKRIWRETKLADGSRLSSRKLAELTGHSQSTCTRLIAEVRKELAAEPMPGSVELI